MVYSLIYHNGYKLIESLELHSNDPVFDNSLYMLYTTLPNARAITGVTLIPPIKSAAKTGV